MTEKTIDQALAEGVAILGLCGLTRERVIAWCIHERWYPLGVTPDALLDQMKRERRKVIKV